MQTQASIKVTGTRTAPARTVTETHLAMNIKAIVEADKAMAEAKAVRDKAVESIASLHGRGKHVVSGFGEVTISANNVYDQSVMLDALKPGQFRLVSERRLVPAKVRAQYPAIYEGAKSERGVKASARCY